MTTQDLCAFSSALTPASAGVHAPVPRSAGAAPPSASAWGLEALRFYLSLQRRAAAHEARGAAAEAARKGRKRAKSSGGAAAAAAAGGWWGGGSGGGSSGGGGGGGGGGGSSTAFPPSFPYFYPPPPWAHQLLAPWMLGGASAPPPQQALDHQQQPFPFSSSFAPGVFSTITATAASNPAAPPPSRFLLPPAPLLPRITLSLPSTATHAAVSASAFAQLSHDPLQSPEAMEEGEGGGAECITAWSARASSASSSAAPPLLLQCARVDCGSGAEAWRAALPCSSSGARATLALALPLPAAGHTLLLLGTTDSQLFVLDARTGERCAPTLCVGGGPVRHVAAAAAADAAGAATASAAASSSSSSSAAPSLVCYAHVATLTCDGTLRQWRLVGEGRGAGGGAEPLGALRLQAHIHTSVAEVVGAVACGDGGGDEAVGEALVDGEAAVLAGSGSGAAAAASSAAATAAPAQVSVTALTLSQSLCPVVVLHRHPAAGGAGRVRSAFAWSPDAGAWSRV